MPNWADAIYERLARYVPDRVLRYVLPLSTLALTTAVIWLCYLVIGPRPVYLYALLRLIMLLIMLGASWLGYGPGIVVCTLVTFVIPRAFPAQPRRPVDLGMFGLLLTVSLLISWIGQSRRRTEADLRKTAEDLERRYRERSEEATRTSDSIREQVQLLDLAHDAILSMDWNGCIRFWNRGAAEMYGWTAEEAVGRVSHELLQTVFPAPRPEIEAKLASSGRWEGELIHRRRDGTQLHVASRWAINRDAQGEPAGYLEINTDMSQARRIEEQLRHTQKLESLGVLAGGIAHDFNNLLTGIMGNASMVLDRMPPEDPDRDLLQDVLKASEHAANLTRQLLAYAGKGRFVMKRINLSKLIREIAALLQTSIPKQVQLRMQLADDLPLIEADPGQMQQIVMNLILNGAEAIGQEHGSLLVRTNSQPVDREYLDMLTPAAEQLTPGEYTCLEVHDTGHGMDEATIARIFDPFFTTKFTGRGLGLSAVLGIVRSHHGALKVYSQPGHGTTFKLLFPVARADESATVSAAASRPAGNGTVLVVDDEEIVRNAARNALERHGYRALLAENGPSAIAVYRLHGPGAITAVLLDLTMPLMNGEEVMRELQQINPAVRVLLSSGYNEVEAIQRFAGKGLAGFIQKPYTAAALAEKLTEVVRDAGAGGTLEYKRKEPV
jgi:two-component system cell cycle sensor histidine kinase/response regulator CckA